MAPLRFFILSVLIPGYVNCQTENPLYPPNSLLNVGQLYNFGGDMPAERVHHTAAFLEPYVIIYAGASASGNLLDDLHMYDLRMQKWTGAITREECCNRAEEVVERLGSTTDDHVLDLPIGFEGGLPAARADHAVAVSGGKMYMYGGYTDTFGLMNDLFAFDPVALRWVSITSVGSSWPCRRGGHSLHAASDRLYLFGGRTELEDSSASSLNDVWIFDVTLNSWTIAINRESETPVGRQHAASAIYGRNLFVFGGMDVASALTFNDMWSFHLDAYNWKQLSPNSGNVYGFAPPPLHHAHLIPTSKDPGVMVYGGIGSGGSCGGSACEAGHTVLGQLYRFDITKGEWASVLETSFTTNTYPATEYVASGEWAYARISSSDANDTGGSSKLTKTVALERIAVAEERSLVFEFGGVELAQNLSASEDGFSHEYPQGEGGLVERSSQGNNYYEAGGILHNDLWDLHTGEHIRENVEIPINSKWWELNSPFAAIDGAYVSYLRQFRQYSFAAMDMILLSTDRSDI